MLLVPPLFLQKHPWQVQWRPATMINSLCFLHFLLYRPFLICPTRQRCRSLSFLTKSTLFELTMTCAASPIRSSCHIFMTGKRTCNGQKRNIYVPMMPRHYPALKSWSMRWPVSLPFRELNNSPSSHSFSNCTWVAQNQNRRSMSRFQWIWLSEQTVWLSICKGMFMDCHLPGIPW